MSTNWRSGIAALLGLLAGASYSALPLAASAQDGAPAPPTDLLAIPAVDGGPIELRWVDNATNEQTYIVERSTTGPDGPWTEIDRPPANSSSYIDDTIVANETYWYRVAASNDVATSTYSNVESATASSPGPPTPPISDESLVTPTIQLPSTGAGSESQSDRNSWAALLGGLTAAAFILAAAGFFLRRS